MSYFNKYKDVYGEVHSPINIRSEGEFTFETFKGVEFPRGSGNVFEFAGTRKRHNVSGNLVTDYGLESIGEGWAVGTGVTSRYYSANYIHVGTGNTPPANGDTSLGSWVASVENTNNQGISSGCTTVAPIYGWVRYQGRFSPGFAGGNVNLNEAGVSHASGSLASLNSKALTVDDNGDPATVTVLADEYLDVFYTRRNYPDYINAVTGAPEDGTGSFDVSGVTYNYTIRPALIGNAEWGYWCARGFQVNTGFGWNDTVAWAVFEASVTLGAITSVPSGSYDTGYGVQDNQYVPNSKEEFIRFGVGLNDGNVTGGIGGAVLKSNLGCYQMTFDNPIPKDNTKTLNLIQRFSWDRKTIV